MRVAINIANYYKISLDWLIGCTDDSESVSKRDLINEIDSLSEEDKKEALKYIQYIKTKKG